jgi:ribosomal protein S12 methylthiotransferase
MPLKINIVTLGCSKNLVDSEYLAGCLQKPNYEVEFDSNKRKFDAVIINTCGFINEAKEEAIETILSYCEQKKNANVKRVIVCGCLSQLYGKELREEIKEVDAFFGTAQWKEILQYLNQNLPQPTQVSRLLSTPKHYAYLKISEGCDRSCSFCSIPLIRGKNISRPMEEIVAEAQLLAQQGVKELILVAQDTTYYGLDLYQERRLVDLLKQIAKIESIVWIRIQYTYPNQFPMELLELMKQEPKICKYLDMPLQHISTPLLESMRRMISGEDTKALVKKIKQELPQLAFRTTFIVGYCGETKEQFEQLKDFVQQMRFERMGAFKYSPQEGTASFDLPDDVSEGQKEARLNALTELQQEISLAKNLEKIGKTFKVIIDRQEGDFWIGRTEFDSPEVDNEVLISTKYNLQTGDFVNAKITDALEFDLLAEVVK